MKTVLPPDARRVSAERFVTLDGMRGVAAIAVALFHFDTALMPHGYLAVDFFFALSGFVLYRTYLPRWREGLGFGRFMLQRLARLYPLFLLGVLLSACAAAHRFALGRDLMLDYHDIGVSMLLNAAMLPSPVEVPLYPLNVPAWSLAFEVIANAALILFLLRLPRWAMLAICVVAAAWLVPVLLDHGSGNIGALWSEWRVALARTAFSFTAGVLIATLPAGHMRPTGMVGLVCLALVAVMLGANWPGIATARYDVTAIVLVSPVLLYLGTRFEPVRLMAPVAAFVGEVSYALYAVHWAFIDLFRIVQEALGWSSLAMAPWFLAAMLALSWACVRWYDMPLRRRLSGLARGPIARPVSAGA